MNITIRDVGPRDGLQPEQPLPVEDRLALVRALAAAGVRHIEVAAFVSPRAVPAMAGAAEVVAGLPDAPGVTWWALVPNVKGAGLAAEAGIDHLTMTVSASETYSRRNVGMSTEESMAAAVTIAGMAPVVDVAISAAFGSPYEGEIAPSLVASLAERCREAGAAVTLADTTGMATPRRLNDVLERTGTDVGLHLHDTRATALVNAYAAMGAGVRRFDTAVGGLGGSPFAAGAGGNLATEDLVHLCDDIGVVTGIDLERLLEASALVAGLVGRPVPSRLAAAGPRGRLAKAEPEG
ncbi:MAG TPA: hydroxymethylglutaryl-CoA lyase [Acidimicrobiales bacterium]|nr:hydroxymethylglutaryl-CoA lyase [Acidimicrobiales bacterium]